MAFLKKSEARAALSQKYGQRLLTKSADNVLKESAGEFTEQKTYDVFLSHAREDASLILGVKAFLEEQGYSVYVDWIDDAQLDRTRVTTGTAQLLRVRMSRSMSLLFVTSDAARSSVWMPWELGYFDGLRKGNIAVLPILEDYQNSFQGQEYLGLYPVVEKDAVGKLFLPKSPRGQIGLREFVEMKR
jgi:hypothetical protein